MYRSAGVVGNICVHAAQDKSKPIAIIVPTEGGLKQLASQKGVSDKGFEDIVRDQKVNDAVLKELQATGKSGGLNGIELIGGVVLADEEWTPQNVRHDVFLYPRALLANRSFQPGPYDLCPKVEPQGHPPDLPEASRPGLLESFVVSPQGFFLVRNGRSKERRTQSWKENRRANA